ncbi:MULTISPECIES: DUF961 family protein [unclassified Granulicatella]|uniref:DUF961 family protein n=1 Tax=unclassified Granulicatella TaxID=2630493 RepID=UPI001073D1AA|nr:MULTISPECIES: DUF961 family protein [unclassified Granulicatella]MBF0780676.1 DUF961 family protein [Granulicatella sp. 19428wC4_WM01]TFU94253.1 DUF961 domain-containing protein [Granulicatella sp. WM01]
MALNVVSIENELGILRYFGQYVELTERVQGKREPVVVGIRYKLISYSGLGKDIIINTKHVTPIDLPMNTVVEVVNPVVHVGFQRIGDNVVPNAVIYADDIKKSHKVK